MRGLTWIYPDRKRCYRCRKYLGITIIDGLYDSYACAGRPHPDRAPPETWPRQHFVWVNGQRRKEEQQGCICLRLLWPLAYREEEEVT